MADDDLSRLSDDEKTALAALLKRAIDEDRFPRSPQIYTLKGILAKLEPPKPAPAPLGGEARTFAIGASHPHHGEMGTSGLSAEGAWYLYLAWMARVATEPGLIIKVMDQATGQVLANPEAELRRLF
jgi:hypothetical protein